MKSNKLLLVILALFSFLQSKADVEINETNFPDSNFREYLKAQTYGADGVITDSEIAAIKSIWVQERQISTLKGIEYFTALKSLTCYNNQLSTLDVSKNTALTSLSCDNNQLTSLDVSKNTALTYLNCQNNQLTTLDVSNNTALTYLNCQNNQLTTLDVSNNTTLTSLYCDRNKLTSLDVSNNTTLKSLGCENNQLTSLDVSNNTALTYLSCYDNQLTSLDVSNNTTLKSLGCENNQLTSLDVSKNTALETLYCYNNQLTSLDVSKNMALTDLSCYSNQIRGEAMDVLVASLPTVDNNRLHIIYNENEGNEMTPAQVAAAKAKGWFPRYYNGSYWLDYSGTIRIDETNFPDSNFREYLKAHTYGADGVITGDEIAAINLIDVHERQISTLKGIDYFTALETLVCHNNKLASLDVSKNTALTSLGCSFNQLTSLDVSKNTALTNLSCSDNQLTSLDVSNNTALRSLLCNNNQLTILDVSKNTALTLLVCYNNQLTSLDVSKNTALTSLHCYNNQLTSLDVSNNSALKSLDFRDNQLTSLDVSKNTALTTLSCDRNKLTSLDVSKNTALTYLSCYSNQIRGEAMDVLVASLPTVDNKSLYIIYNENEGNEMTPAQVAAAKAKGWIPQCYNGSFWLDYSGAFRIDETNFPDPNFRDYLKTRTYGADGVITDSEIAAITSISVSEKQISNLQGIEYFTALKSLDCYNNQLSTLDVSKNTALTSLSCQNNQLTSLDVSKNTALTSLTCYNNQLTSLDVSKNTALKSVQCLFNQLSSLDFSKNIALTSVSCGENQLTSLDVSKNTALTSLSCQNNQLTSLDVSKNTALTSLICSKNQLTSLDVSKNTALTFLSCYNNQLTSLDVSKNTALTSLGCDRNKLTSLDVSKNTALTYLSCYSNQIRGEAMDALVASLPSTEYGSLCIIYNENEGNEMTAAQVAAAKAKGWIPQYYNGASSGDYAGYDAVIEINETNFPDEYFREYLKTQSYGTDGVISIAEFVDIKTMDVSSKQIASLKGIEYFTSLTDLNCGGNQLTSLDVSRNSKLTYLVCDDNKLTSLDVSKNTALTSLFCRYNQLTSLDVSKNTALTSLLCGGNKLTSLDVSKNIALRLLQCFSNQLTSLDVSKNTALTSLYCYNNQLSSLDVSKNTALGSLRCEKNQLTSLDVSKNIALRLLQCFSNQLTSLDVSKNSDLLFLHCYNNQLTSLDVSKNTALIELYCHNNQIKGEAMDALVASLPTVSDRELKIIGDENEGNEMTTVQVASAKAKGWIPQYHNGSKWTEYAGVPVEFKLTYMVDGVEYKSCNIEYGATITPETNPEKETYRFLGWSEIPETMPSHDVTVTGAFERYFTVGNVARLVSFVINGNATSDEVELYDQNTDEELNIGDIILVVKWILNNDNSGPSNSRTRSYNVPDWTQYTAAQFDVRTTADTNIKEIRLVKGMEQTHQMMYQQKDAYTYTVVVYSLSNQLMKPENGNIVEITTDKNTLNGVSIENVIVALPTGETESYNGAHLSTNILQIEGEEGPAVVYDLKGNRMNVNSNLKKGVYIVNGKKVIVK